MTTTRFKVDDERKHLFQNNFVFVRVIKWEQTLMFPFQLINNVSGSPSVSDPINDRRVNVSFKRSGPDLLKNSRKIKILRNI